MNGDVDFMNLAAFSLSQIQIAKTLLDIYMSKGIINCVDVINSLDTVMNKRMGTPIDNLEKDTSPQKQERNTRLCPSCGIGRLVPVKNNEKLFIVGCSKCRYSKILTPSKE